jgi:hypothetical protein
MDSKKPSAQCMIDKCGIQRDKCADKYVLDQGNASCPNLFILTALINSDEQIL